MQFSIVLLALLPALAHARYEIIPLPARESTWEAIYVWPALHASISLLTIGFITNYRFGQENAVQNIIQALGGGAASTLAGQSISTLLAGSSACDKLSLADQVLALPGVDAVAALAAAKALVAAEKNFNPFAVSIPTICDNPALPASIQLRGIVPKSKTELAPINPQTGSAYVEFPPRET